MLLRHRRQYDWLPPLFPLLGQLVFEGLVCYLLGPFCFYQLFQGKCLGLAEVLEALGVALDGHGVLFAESGLVGWFFMEGAEESDIGHSVG